MKPKDTAAAEEATSLTQVTPETENKIAEVGSESTQVTVTPKLVKKRKRYDDDSDPDGAFETAYTSAGRL